MLTSPSPISHFEIIGLHGDKNIYIDFQNAIKIIINENGVGKTTVLNALFNFLSGNWYKLAQLDFNRISAKFINGTEVSVEQSELVADNSELTFSTIIETLQTRLAPSKFNKLAYDSRRLPMSLFMRECEEVSGGVGIPSRIVADALIRFKRTAQTSDRSLFEKPSGKTAEIRAAFPYTLLYFPTYRRVEEDLQSLGYIERALNQDDALIQFGMQDVKSRFNAITSEIRDSSVEWYSIINGRILTQLIGGIKPETIAYNQIENPNTLRIVLDRIGENITDNNKNQILEIITNAQIKDDKYAPLAYFLSNLTQVYEKGTTVKYVGA